MRNGVVERWDLRQPSAASDTVVNMSSKADRTGGAPVQHLRLVHQHGLLVETMRGDVSELVKSSFAGYLLVLLNTAGDARPPFSARHYATDTI